jgi:hypothetical protein
MNVVKAQDTGFVKKLIPRLKKKTATFTAKGKTKSDVLHLSQEKNHNAS